MSAATDPSLDRRALLALAGAAAFAPLVAGAAAGAAAPDGAAIRDEARPDHAQLLALFAKAHARLDGKPAFWISRGREYGFVDGHYQQVYERHVVSATRAVLAADGSMKASYCEAAYAAAAGETKLERELASPFTGKPYPNPVLRPLKMTWNVSPAGVVAARIDTPNVRSRYDGRIDTQLGPDGTTLIDALVQITVHRGDGTMSLSEVGPYVADWAAERHGFVPARRTLTVYRTLPDNLSGGAAGVMLGSHVSRKHATLAALRRALTASETAAFQEWFGAWEKMIMAPEDFVLPAPNA